jgi:hypothetical protein
MIVKRRLREFTLSTLVAWNDRWIFPLHCRHLSDMNKIRERNYGEAAHRSPRSQSVPHDLHRETVGAFRLVAH